MTFQQFINKHSSTPWRHRDWNLFKRIRITFFFVSEFPMTLKWKFNSFNGWVWGFLGYDLSKLIYVIVKNRQTSLSQLLNSKLFLHCLSKGVWRIILYWLGILLGGRLPEFKLQFKDVIKENKSMSYKPVSLFKSLLILLDGKKELSWFSWPWIPAKFHVQP